jgi:glucose-6-phosphate 1-dehydrogenase
MDDRESAEQAVWRVVDPVLGNIMPVHEYEPDSWGPAEADTLIARDGSWHPLMPSEPRNYHYKPDALDRR